MYMLYLLKICRTGNEFGVVLNAKQCPQLEGIQMFINERKNTLRLMYPKKQHLDVNLRSLEKESGRQQQQEKKGFEQQSFFDYGEAAAEWVSQVLEMKNVRLVSNGDEEDGNGAKTKSMIPVDAYFSKPRSVAPLRILNMSSVLNFLANYGGVPSDAEVEEILQICRPNFIVYGGAGELHEGDQIRIQELVLKVNFYWRKQIGGLLINVFNVFSDRRPVDKKPPQSLECANGREDFSPNRKVLAGE